VYKLTVGPYWNATLEIATELAGSRAREAELKNQIDLFAKESADLKGLSTRLSAEKEELLREIDEQQGQLQGELHPCAGACELLLSWNGAHHRNCPPRDDRPGCAFVPHDDRGVTTWANVLQYVVFSKCLIHSPVARICTVMTGSMVSWLSE